MIPCECGDCGSTYKVKDQNAGKRFKCKYCDAMVSVPTKGKPKRKSAGGSSGGRPSPQRRKKAARRKQQEYDDYEDYSADEYESYDDYNDYEDDGYDDYGGGYDDDYAPSPRRAPKSKSKKKKKKRRSSSESIPLVSILFIVITSLSLLICIAALTLAGNMNPAGVNANAIRAAQAATRVGAGIGILICGGLIAAAIVRSVISWWILRISVLLGAVLAGIRLVLLVVGLFALMRAPGFNAAFFCGSLMGVLMQLAISIAFYSGFGGEKSRSYYGA